MKELNFYKNQNNNSILIEIGTALDKNGPDSLELIKANSVDAAVEKHVPVVSVENGKLVIRTGSQPHPMQAEHYIDWVLVKTTYGGTFCNLEPGDEPEVKLDFAPEEVLSVYAYCNLHGLWKAQEPVLPASFEQNTTACSPEFTEGCVDSNA